MNAIATYLVLRPWIIDGAAMMCALVLIAVLIWIVHHLERRLQHVEHEIATLLDSKGVLTPTTPEVKRRYDAMGAARFGL